MIKQKHTLVKKPANLTDTVFAADASSDAPPQPDLAESEAPYTAQPLEQALDAVRKMKGDI
jgi:hypothetical protein